MNSVQKITGRKCFLPAVCTKQRNVEINIHIPIVMKLENRNAIERRYTYVLCLNF